MRTLVALLVIAAVAFSQPETFRWMSTSGLIYDDLDLWAGGLLHLQPLPDRLVEIEGYRLYTGLANLSTGDDAALDEDDDGEGGFLIGGSALLPGSEVGLGAIADFFDRRIFEEIELTGPGGVLASGEGQVEASWSEFVDEDGDGAFDTRHTEHHSASGWEDSTQTAAGVFAGWAPGARSLSIGAGAAMVRNSVSEMPSSMNYMISMSDTNLVTGTPTYAMDLSSEGEDAGESSAIIAVLSGSGAMGDYMIGRGMFMFQSLSGEQAHTLSAEGQENGAPGQPGVYDLLSWQRSEDYSVDISGSAFGGGAGLDYTLAEGWLLELGGGFYTSSVDGTTNTFSSELDSLYQLTQGSLLETTSIAVDGSGDLAAALEETHVRGGAKVTAGLADDLILSLGAFFDSQSSTETNTMELAYAGTMSFDDGDTQYADPDDYTATTSWSQTEEEKVTSSTTRISLPVGLELPVIPRLVARLGADPAFVWEEETTTNTLLDASPAVTEVVYGDGTTDESVGSPWITYDGTLVSSEESRTEIPFSYGLGFSATENLQVDLMGMGLGYIDQWRISATLLF